jgi:hypothetical protein
MFARIAKFDGVNVEAAERTLDTARERIEPIMRGMAGFQGYMELIDRSAKRAVTIAFFDSEENLNTAEPTFDEEMPKQLADLFQEWEGRRSSVERYEVLVDERGS